MNYDASYANEYGGLMSGGRGDVMGGMRGGGGYRGGGMSGRSYATFNALMM